MTTPRFLRRSNQSGNVLDGREMALHGIGQIGDCAPIQAAGGLCDNHTEAGAVSETRAVRSRLRLADRMGKAPADWRSSRRRQTRVRRYLSTPNAES